MLLSLPDQGVSNFTGFDVFMILFTVLLLIAVIRLLTAKRRNLFAIGFTGIALATFLFMDYHMILNWFGTL